MNIKLIKDFDVKTLIKKKLTYFVLIYTLSSQSLSRIRLPVTLVVWLKNIQIFVFIYKKQSNLTLQIGENKFMNLPKKVG